MRRRPVFLLLNLNLNRELKNFTAPDNANHHHISIYFWSNCSRSFFELNRRKRAIRMANLDDLFCVCRLNSSFTSPEGGHFVEKRLFRCYFEPSPKISTHQTPVKCFQLGLFGGKKGTPYDLFFRRGWSKLNTFEPVQPCLATLTMITSSRVPNGGVKFIDYHIKFIPEFYIRKLISIILVLKLPNI